MEEKQYVSPFTEESVEEVSNFVHKAIAEYCTANNKKIDIYALIAGLNKVAYEVVLRSSARTKEEADVIIGKMRDVAADITHSLDERRTRENDGGTFEVLGSIFATSVVTEFYSKLRDERNQLAERLQDEAVRGAGEIEAAPVQEEAKPLEAEILQDEASQK